MQLNRLPKMAGHLVCAFTMSFAVLLVTPAFSASKAKPDLPIGEEADHSAPAARTSEKAASSAAPAGGKGLAEKELEESKAMPQGEEKDPYAHPPAAHGEEKKPHSPVDSAAGHSEKNHDTDKADEPETHAAPSAKPKLLEGKVDPATPTQGKGLIWFAVVFVLLSIAIFIFT